MWKRCFYSLNLRYSAIVFNLLAFIATLSFFPTSAPCVELDINPVPLEEVVARLQLMNLQVLAEAAVTPAHLKSIAETALRNNRNLIVRAQNLRAAAARAVSRGILLYALDQFVEGQKEVKNLQRILNSPIEVSEVNIKDFKKTVSLLQTIEDLMGLFHKLSILNLERPPLSKFYDLVSGNHLPNDMEIGRASCRERV